MIASTHDACRGGTVQKSQVEIQDQYRNPIGIPGFPGARLKKSPGRPRPRASGCIVRARRARHTHARAACRGEQSGIDTMSEDVCMHPDLRITLSSPGTVDPARGMARLLHLALATAVQLLPCASTELQSSRAAIVAAVEDGDTSSALLQQAAREVRRYHFASTGELLPLLEQVPCQALEELAARSAVLLVSAGCAATAAAAAADRSSPLLRQLLTVAALSGEEHILIKQQGLLASPTAVLLGGGSPRGVLHGAYFYAEHGLGVHFAIGGDSVPQQQSEADLAQRLRGAPTNDVQSPVFATRGLVPFHDFAEGPDFWTEQDYKAYTTQMSKLRMNFVGFHSYNYYNEVHADANVTVSASSRSTVPRGI
eukprot:COSAG02_NODE_550_length_20437_cov_4.270676_19_plen_368_part_00